jgi:hypothetical protein
VIDLRVSLGYTFYMDCYIEVYAIDLKQALSDLAELAKDHVESGYYQIESGAYVVWASRELN